MNVITISDAQYNRSMPTWMALARAAMLCNKSEFKNPNDQSDPMTRFVYANNNNINNVLYVINAIRLCFVRICNSLHRVLFFTFKW